MDYNQCRQFNPPGWGTARMAAPCRPKYCDASGYCLRPTYQPGVTPLNSGMNLAKDESIKDNPDHCHGRRFCPPSKETPITVQLKMCPAAPAAEADYDSANANISADYSNFMGNRRRAGYKTDPFCPNTCPLPRCPPGTKVERTLPIIPMRKLQESYFKMNNASVYSSDYVGRKVTPTPSFSPINLKINSTGSFQQKSLTKVDYKPHVVCPYKKPPWAFAKAREESNLKMNGISSYKTDYVEKEGKPAPSAKPVRYYNPERSCVNDRTEYQIEYIPRELPDPVLKLKVAAQRRNCVPFDGLTVYRKDYIPKKAKPALSVLDKSRSYNKNRPAMDGVTTYTASFEPFHFESRECIPPKIYDQMYPPRDKCSEVRCYPEKERIPEDPIQSPVPPCPPPTDKSYCPSPYETLCSPKAVPCVSPYVLKKEANPYGESTVIRVEHNFDRNAQNGPVEYTCPQQTCKVMN